MSSRDTFGRNLRHGVRLLVKSPGFTIAAVATIALGIGANTAIYSLIRTVMLQPLPYAAPDNLVMLWRPSNPEDMTWLSIREVVAYRQESTTLGQLAAYVETNANLIGGTEPERVPAAAVTADLFDLLGVAPILGRAFTPGEDATGSAEVVMLGHGLWQRRFGGQATIIGQTIRVNGRPRVVVGVMPPSFRLPVDYRADRPSQLWYPLAIDPANLGQWGNRSYFGVGRLAPGITPSQASSEFKVIADRWVQAGYMQPSLDGGLYRDAIPVEQFITGDVRRPLLILFGAVGVVLLIACANVVNLLLARADTRRREIAVRGALGARRADIVWQLLTESLLLSGVGGALGLAIAQGAIRVLTTLRPAGLPRVEDAALDTSALAFTATLALVSGVLFGLAPAFQLSRQQFAPVLNESGRGGGPGRVRRGVRRGLVITQLAFSVVLVVGAGLLLRSLIELNRIDLGFDPDRVLTAQLQLPLTDYPQPSDAIQFYRQLTERLADLPGVTAAGAVRVLPLARTIGDWSITIEGRPLATPNENPNGDYQGVTSGYFRAMGTSLVRGRFLTDADREDAPLVALINDTMAARYWPGQDAIGRRFQMGGTGTVLSPIEIVGIVRTTRHNEITEAPRAEIYLAHAQLPRAVGGPARAMAIVMKTEGDPTTYIAALRDTVRSLDQNLPVADIQPMRDVTATALARPRFATLLLGIFAVLALILAAIGTYATVSLLVSERSHEIGIRMALGAGKSTILAWVLAEGLVMAAGGITIGIAGALVMSRVLESLLYGVGTIDPVTFTVVPILLAVIAAIAALHPARRAAALDPAVTLRQGR
jgi:predicted permease